MNQIILNDIPCELDTQKIAKRLHVEPGSEDYNDLESLLIQVVQVARPKAIYKPIFIEEKGSDFVMLDNQKMVSTVMPQNLKDVHQIGRAHV